MTQGFTETADQTAIPGSLSDDPGLPGALLVFSSGEPMSGALPIVQGKELVLGRGQLHGIELRDNCMSRRHASVRREEKTWCVIDHESRNGTYVNGQLVTDRALGADFKTVRVGETVFLLLEDIRPFLRQGVEERDDSIVGVQMTSLLQAVSRAAQTGVLHITGETGSGKEVVARAFHKFGAGARDRFVAVNCATIPEGLAERLLFGTKKGAFSGADRDAQGTIQEANGGTLFLDEIGELDLAVQAKLLRVLEAREVVPLGATRPVPVDVSLCSATHRDLRQAVADKTFREDLFFRLGRPRVAIPPLRERPEEIPFLVARQLREVSSELVAQAALVESCMLRTWPGNIRELLVEIRDAATHAQSSQKSLVKLSHLAADAGADYGPSHSSAPGAQESVFPAVDVVRAALIACDGRVATAARHLGLHRNQLRRWMDKHPESKSWGAAPSSSD